MLSGLKETFAIECVIQDPLSGLGNIYFWLLGVRVGNDLFPYELSDYFYGALAALDSIPQSQELVGVNAETYVRLVDWLYEESTACPIPDVANEVALRDAVDQSVWRDYHASDHVLLGVANGREQQVIHAIRKDAPSISVRTEPNAFQFHLRHVATLFNATSAAA